jgi:hypothetical protein
MTKQCALAQKKSELLDEEIKEYEQERCKMKADSVASLNRTHYLPSLKSTVKKTLNKTNLLKSTDSMEQPNSLTDKRTRCKIESMKEYLDYLSQEESTL